MTTTTLDSIHAAPANLRTSWLAAGVAAIASGCLLALAMSLHPAWWAGWLAPAPMLAAALADGRPGRARWMGALAGAIGATSTFGYYAPFMSTPGAVAILLLRGMMWGAALSLTVGAARRAPAWIAVFVLPLFTAAVDTVVLTVSPHGSYGSYAYSQMDALPVIQAAALGGAPAIVFVTLTGASLLGFLAARLMGAAPGWRATGFAALAAGGLVAAALLFGASRPAAAPRGPEQQVVLIASGRIQGHAHDWAQVLQVYGPAMRGEARPGATVVLPEVLASLNGAQAQAAAAEVSALSRATGANFLVGLEVRFAPKRIFNRALLASPDGRVRWYDKERLVPGLESPRITPGRSPLVTQVGAVRTAVSICKDMHFPDLGREYGAAGPQLMLTPAWDFVRDGWMSDRLSLLRGVEGGYAMARAARDGISSVSDRYGRILAEGVSRPDAVTVVRASLRLGPADARTLYDRIGDSFGWMCLALLAALRLWIWRADRRAASAA